MTRRKFTSKFKTKVVLDALSERMTTSKLAQKYNLTPQQISTWKREFVSNAEGVFESQESKQTDDQDRDRLLRTIGELKVEVDFLKKALR
ncbi:transposase [Membranihabitans marinus]|uniref:transposase n=1 Tax=Membranihabitans marinus TaxID=1227546 RepID=UPI001F00B94D|nr:transposase [Membranihabitans marinus]